ncbi:PQQ-dependent sugar dehydrogenase [Actinoplanes sp. NPDC051859]|uniref:PQQ-dependent sugar dehydrogenase n=1 Tax=Actinoplanes sp. NPDC051859 TaxID=3363909 RepID=UPI00379CE4D4
MTSAARWGIAVATASVVLLTACSGDEGESPGASPTTGPSATAPTTAGGTSPAPSASRGTPDLSRPETMATGLDTPWGLAFLPGGDALVAERDTARIMRIPAGGGEPREVYKVPGVAAGGEGGLLGLAVAEDYAKTKLVYAYFTAATDNRIVRFTLGSSAAPTAVFDGIDKAGIHNGGRIAFGPDKMLYVGTGDASDRPTSQNPDDANGKILRLTPEGKPAPGNPKAGSPVWSLGHRNVQGLAWTADKTMYAAEFGQNRFDELNKIEPGRNYGWPEVEGTANDDRFVNPVATWTTEEASPSGVAIAGNTAYVAGLRGERLWTVPLGGGKPKAELTEKYGRLRTVAVAPDGALWVTTSNTDGRGDVRDGDDRVLRFPAR